MGYPGDDGRLPVIYVRGFAGNGSAINSAVDDPFYGFSQGSVHVRADSNGRAKFHQFESPLLRLITDHKYEVPVHGDQWAFLQGADTGAVNPASVWIHRFYDQSAATFSNDPESFSFEEAARDLFDLIKLVLEKTGAPKVFLVAHSMGGLICRSLLQRVIPENQAAARMGTLTRQPEPDTSPGYSPTRRPTAASVSLSAMGCSNAFGTLPESTVRTSLAPTACMTTSHRQPKGRHGHVMTSSEPRCRMDGFPVDELFCLVGSNPEDYDAAFGLSSKAVGARSDGLVQINNAAVKGAPLAIVHRSHSGRYGIVNSEEGYQNLQRFLFGDLKIQIDLVGFTVGRDAPGDVVFQLDVGLAIRGLPVLVHEQSATHFCPVQIEHWKEGDPIDSPVPLLTAFLSSKAPRPRVGGQQVATLRHALKLRLMSIQEKQGRFFFDDHMEQTEDWQDTLLVDIEPPGSGRSLPRTWAAWNSTIPTAIRDWNPGDTDLLTDTDDTPNRWRGRIDVPDFFKELLGQKAGLRLTVTPRKHFTF
ncbi:esterase/lipase family protein [Pseudarthrobacter sp. So.54]